MNVTHTINYIQSLYESYKNAPISMKATLRESFCAAVQVADLLLYENFSAHITIHDGIVSVKEA